MGGSESSLSSGVDSQTRFYCSVHPELLSGKRMPEGNINVVDRMEEGGPRAA